PWPSRGRTQAPRLRVARSGVRVSVSLLLPTVSAQGTCLLSGLRAAGERGIGRTGQDPALVIQLRHAVGGEDRLNAGAVGFDQPLHPVLPLALAEAHAHRDAEVELDLRVRLERHDDHRGGGRAPREVPGDRSPYERDIDRAGREVLLDDLARIALGIAGLELVGNDLVEQAVLEQPIGRRRLTEYAELERFQLCRLEPEQALGNGYAIETLALRIDERVSRAIIGLGGGRQLETDRYSQYQIALEAVGIGIAPAQRVADESHALREPRVLERPSQFARQ